MQPALLSIYRYCQSLAVMQASSMIVLSVRFFLQTEACLMLAVGFRGALDRRRPPPRTEAPTSRPDARPPELHRGYATRPPPFERRPASFDRNESRNGEWRGRQREDDRPRMDRSRDAGRSRRKLRDSRSSSESRSRSRSRGRSRRDRSRSLSGSSDRSSSPEYSKRSSNRTGSHRSHRDRTPDRHSRDHRYHRSHH